MTLLYTVFFFHFFYHTLIQHLLHMGKCQQEFTNCRWENWLGVLRKFPMILTLRLWWIPFIQYMVIDFLHLQFLLKDSSSLKTNGFPVATFLSHLPQPKHTYTTYSLLKFPIFHPSHSILSISSFSNNPTENTIIYTQGAIELYMKDLKRTSSFDLHHHHDHDQKRINKKKQCTLSKWTRQFNIVQRKLTLHPFTVGVFIVKAHRWNCSANFRRSLISNVIKFARSLSPWELLHIDHLTLSQNHLDFFLKSSFFLLKVCVVCSSGFAIFF